MHDRRYLELVLQLSRIGVVRDADVGDTVARFFADLGAEEFQVLPNGRLLSLHTGNISERAQDAELFVVLGVDEIVQAIVAQGGDIEAVELLDARTWRVRVRRAGQTEESEDRSLPSAFARLLLQMVSGEEPEELRQSGRGLITVSG